MYQEIIVLIFVLVAAGYSLRSIIKQFSSSEDAGCSSCSSCDSSSSGIINNTDSIPKDRQRPLKYSRINSI